MHEVQTVRELQSLLQKARGRGRHIGLVPTMGALHAGHDALIAASTDRGDSTVVSIFVNPTQFGPAEDLLRYPRDLAGDRMHAESVGTDILFVPSVTVMYPDGADAQAVWVDPGHLAAHLDGARRRGHFRGVCTVVAKLFNMARPDYAYFGQKDVQQLRLIERMVRDLAMDTEIVGVPTVREPDGLALSSRNRYLSVRERQQASALFRGLSAATVAYEQGERNWPVLEEIVQDVIRRDAPLAHIDFVQAVDPVAIAPLADIVRPGTIVALAASFGPTRLIDNIILTDDRAGDR